MGCSREELESRSQLTPEDASMARDQEEHHTGFRPARRGFLGAGTAAMLAAALPASGQPSAWKPSQPVRLMNGFAVGGSGEILCRLLAEGLAPIMGQPVVVETRAGANGFIAAEVVANAVPDGQTIGFATMSMLAVAPQLPGLKLPINPQTQLVPIASIAGIYQLLVTAPDAPFRTVPELIAYARANPGKVSYASAGIGSAPHLAAELFRRQAQIDIFHVPYKGGAAAVADLQTGRVQMIIGNMPDYLTQVKAGLLRGVAFAGDAAAPALPDLPLIKSTLPDYAIGNWFAIVGPAQLPDAIINAWAQAIRSVVSEPSFQKRLNEMGAAAMPRTPSEFRALIDTDRKRWGEVIRAANIRAE